jgi:two-component system nitrate/nitrite response regulator NarL
MTTGKRIMIVAAKGLFRDGLQRVVGRPDRIVARSCDTLDQVTAALDPADPPDLIIVGIEASQRVADACRQIRVLKLDLPTVRWIVLGRELGADCVRDAIETGIDGILAEESSEEILQHLIELVLLGHPVLPTNLARLLNDGPIRASEGEAPSTVRVSVPRDGQDRRRVDAADRPTANLSEREQEILSHLAEGRSNKLIALDLRIAEATVKVHVKALLRKLQVKNRTQAAIAAPAILGPCRAARPALTNGHWRNGGHRTVVPPLAVRTIDTIGPPTPRFSSER